VSQCLLPVQPDASQRRPPMQHLTPLHPAAVIPLLKSVVLRLSGQVSETKTSQLLWLTIFQVPRSRKASVRWLRMKTLMGVGADQKEVGVSTVMRVDPLTMTSPESRKTKGASKGPYPCSRTSRSTRPECSPRRREKSLTQQRTGPS
jgi:hypothetical protein